MVNLKNTKNGWQILGNVNPKNLKSTRGRLHQAMQMLDAVARSYVTAQPEFAFDILLCVR